MPKKDILFFFFFILFFLPFFACPKVYQFYMSFNAEHGLIMAFFKFGILATLGESIGLRIRNGVYNEKGFGILPRAIVWGFLGISIKLALVIFAVGTTAFLVYLGFESSSQVMHSDLSWAKLGVAFSISVAMNLIFSPVLMTIHKVTDRHIIQNHGTLRGFFQPVKARQILIDLNWGVMWSFVFKKTIPLFWIPAHTITFLLLPTSQVLFAAFLGIALGTILAVADLFNEKIKV